MPWNSGEQRPDTSARMDALSVSEVCEARKMEGVDGRTNALLAACTRRDILEMIYINWREGEFLGSSSHSSQHHNLTIQNVLFLSTITRSLSPIQRHFFHPSAHII